MRFCFTCWGSREVVDWEPVPASEIEPWQQAELMVNGGEMRQPVKEPCPDCADLW